MVPHGIAGNCENGLVGGTDGVITYVAGIMMRGKKRMIDGQGSMPFAGDSGSYFIVGGVQFSLGGYTIGILLGNLDAFTTPLI